MSASALLPRRAAAGRAAHEGGDVVAHADDALAIGLGMTRLPWLALLSRFAARARAMRPLAALGAFFPRRRLRALAGRMRAMVAPLSG